MQICLLEAEKRTQAVSYTHLVMLDLIIYLGSYHLKDLFGTSWFSVEDFCRKMGYDRSNLQRKLDDRQLEAMFGKNMQPGYVLSLIHICAVNLD